MHRFFQPDAVQQLAGGATSLLLSEGESHHASRVLRMEVGEAGQVLDGKGGIWDAQVEQVGKHCVRMKVLQSLVAPPRVGELEAFVAIAKGSGMEDVVEKLTELGVARIVPLLTERTAVKLNSEMSVAKRDKWEAVAVAAVKQCGNPWLPKVENPRDLGTVLNELREVSTGVSLVMSLEAGCVEVGEWFRSGACQKGGGKIRLFVGPEGDFSPEELQQLRMAGCRPLTLGPWVLRVGTAVVVAAALLLHEVRLAQKRNV